VKLPRDLSRADLIKALARVGYDVTRQTGSHIRITTISPTLPRLKNLLRGKMDKFSLDALLNILSKAGMRVELRVKKAA